MNKRRKLYCLFRYKETIPKGYVCIYKHTSLNDEPPYTMCSFWGFVTNYIKNSVKCDPDDYYTFYLIKEKDAQSLIDNMNLVEKRYLEDYGQMLIENSYEGPGVKLRSNVIQTICLEERYKRRPKVKYMRTEPDLKSIIM